MRRPWKRLHSFALASALFISLIANIQRGNGEILQPLFIFCCLNIKIVDRLFHEAFAQACEDAQIFELLMLLPLFKCFVNLFSVIYYRIRVLYHLRRRYFIDHLCLVRFLNVNFMLVNLFIALIQVTKQFIFYHRHLKILKLFLYKKMYVKQNVGVIERTFAKYMSSFVWD